METTEKKDVIVIGAGAAGFMCAIEAAKRARTVLLLDHSKKIGEKIRISGGGRCNFTNIYASPENYISNNPHFCKSALASYSPYQFISLVEDYDIAYHEKKLGQQFCDNSSSQIIDLLFREARKNSVQIQNRVKIKAIEKQANLDETYRYQVKIESDSEEESTFLAESVVIATGGLSIPQIGATNFGHIIAERFELKVTELKPGLVPFTFTDAEFFSELSGVAIDACASIGAKTFRENILFTHKGLTGPAILQISSYWTKGDILTLNLLPDIDLFEFLKSYDNKKKHLKNILKELLPERFVDLWSEKYDLEQRLAEYSYEKLQQIVNALQQWQLKPNNTEGYKKAEVTVGGVDTDELSSKTMESKKHPGLYFIGEVVDVTGWLGGYNFQWAWASGYAAGQHC